jgi:hypothetical protein
MEDMSVDVQHSVSHAGSPFRTLRTRVPPALKLGYLPDFASRGTSH